MDIKIIKRFGLGFLAILIVTGVVVSFLEPRSNFGQKGENTIINLDTDLSNIFSGQMGFIFYEDKNANGQYDYSEKVFKDVTVALKRPGEAQPFISVPADDKGLVKITNLPVGNYEVQYLNQALEQPIKQGDFIFRPFYEITEEHEVRYSFLPSDWQTVVLPEGGYKVKVGLREYRPKTLLLIREGKILKFYEPIRAKILGQSDLEGVIGDQFNLKNNQLFYFKDQDLLKFSFDNRVTTQKLSGYYGVAGAKYWLSKTGEALLYPLENEWHYQNDSLGCDGAVTGEDQLRLHLLTGRVLADWWDDQIAVVTVRSDNEPAAVYSVQCREGKLISQATGLNQVNTLFLLNSQNLFYSDGNGSYFYDLTSQQSIQYTALGNGEEIMVSPDKKYVVAKLENSLIVVDYPAVKASGVEKHYLLPFSGQVAFAGDEILINQSKPCEADGDCGEIIRIALEGSGVWSIVDRIQLKDLYADEILGEIKL